MDSISAVRGPLVDANNISKNYGHLCAVSPLSFSLWEGEVIGLIGANGGGKTTTLRLIAGLLTPDQGRLKVLGRHLPDHSASFKQQFGYVAQMSSLYGELTVRENLEFRASMYGIKGRSRAIGGVLKTFELKKFEKKTVSELSGGWARLVQLAAGVLHKPKLLLLDEPTAGLDATMRSKVWWHIGQAARAGTGIIVSTHDLFEAMQCTRVMFFAEGNMLAAGAPAEILTQSKCQVYNLKNKDLISIRNKLHKISGCLSCSAENDLIRIVVTEEGVPHLSALAEMTGSVISPSSLTLADASAALLAKGTSDG